MEMSVSTEIEKPITEVWEAIVDFENCQDWIESIIDFEILEQPADTLIGFKWKETRKMFGKEATEIMWITECEEKNYYQTRAESHGSIYKSRLSVEPSGNNTKLTMSFSAEALTFGAKVMSALMGFLVKGSMKKAVAKDLQDIKAHLEGI